MRSNQLCRPKLRVAIAGLVVALSACSPDGPPPRTDVPEPAVSPVPSEAPAGRVVPLAGQPEGLVVDGPTRTIAAGVRNPDGLALIDVDTGVERARRPFAGSPRHLQLARPGGPVLVPAEGTDRLYQVALPDGALVGDVGVGRQPHDATTAGSRTFVGDELADQVSVVEGDRRVQQLPAPVMPGGVAAALDGSVVVAVGVRGREMEAYRPDGTSLGRTRCGVGPTHVRAGPDGRFYVADTQGEALLAFEVGPDGPRQVAKVAAEGAPYGLAIDATRRIAYVTLTATNRVQAFRLDGTTPKADRSWPTLRQPNDVGVDPSTGRIVVAGATDSALQLIDP